MCQNKTIVRYRGCGHIVQVDNNACVKSGTGQCQFSPRAYKQEDGACLGCDLSFSPPGDLMLLNESAEDFTKEQTVNDSLKFKWRSSLFRERLIDNENNDGLEEYYEEESLSVEEVEETIRREEDFLCAWLGVHEETQKPEYDLFDGLAAIRFIFLYNRFLNLLESDPESLLLDQATRRASALRSALTKIPLRAIEDIESASILQDLAHLWIDYINSIGDASVAVLRAHLRRTLAILERVKQEERGDLQKRWFEGAEADIYRELWILHQIHEPAIQEHLRYIRRDRRRQWEEDASRREARRNELYQIRREDTREILSASLLVVEVNSLEENEVDRRCCICRVVYNTIEDGVSAEKAIRLPCGHVLGLDCLLETTLSLGLQCPIGRCDKLQLLAVLIPPQVIEERDRAPHDDDFFLEDRQAGNDFERTLRASIGHIRSRGEPEWSHEVSEARWA